MESSEVIAPEHLCHEELEICWRHGSYSCDEAYDTLCDELNNFLRGQQEVRDYCMMIDLINPYKSFDLSGVECATI